MGQLAFIGFVPLVLFPGGSPGRNFFLGTASGFLFYSLSLSWLYPLAGFLYLLLPLYLSLYWGLFLCLLFLLPARGRVFTGAFVWFFLEVIVSGMMTGFPWLLLGLSQWQNGAMLFFAGIAGIYGVSFMVMLANLSIIHLFRKKHLVSCILSLMLLAAVPAVSRTRLFRLRPAGSLDIMVVQPDVVSSRITGPMEAFNSLKDLTAKSLGEKTPELVIWPEGSLPGVLDEYPEAKREVELMSASRCLHILFGTFTRAGRGSYNSAVMIGNGKIQVYRKNHLVPYGEFIPGGRYKAVRDAFEKIAGYVPDIRHGSGQMPMVLNGKHFAPLICFENIFPGMTRVLDDNGAGAFMVITNDSWYGHAGKSQHFAHNFLRAAESRKYFVQAALSGISGIVPPGGRSIISGRNGVETGEGPGIIFYRVPLMEGRSPYSRTGDMPLFLAGVFLMGALICRR
jgi:apolipoprotein N-acyltransferase